MRTIKAMLGAGLVALAALSAATPALARGHVHWGVSIGVPLWGPGYYPYPYPYAYPYPAYYPPVVAAPVSPPVYIERADQQATAPADNYWYYCPAAKAYY